MFRPRKLEYADSYDMFRTYGRCYGERTWWQNDFRRWNKLNADAKIDLASEDYQMHVARMAGFQMQDIVDHEGSYGVFDGDKMVGFLTGFAYTLTKRIADTDGLFGSLLMDGKGRMHPAESLQQDIADLESDGWLVFYVYAIGVLPEYRRQGIASDLLKVAMKDWCNYKFAAEIFNPDAVGIFEQAGFEVSQTGSSFAAILKNRS